MLSLNHADVEDRAHRCPACRRNFCGSCCLPRWEALKRRKQLSGRALAAELEDDPGAVFMEEPKCPVCRREVERVEGWTADAFPGSPPDTPQQREQEIMSGRISGPLGLGGAYLLWRNAHPVWAVIVALISLAVIAWAYSRRLPKI